MLPLYIVIPTRYKDLHVFTASCPETLTEMLPSCVERLEDKNIETSVQQVERPEKHKNKTAGDGRTPGLQGLTNSRTESLSASFQSPELNRVVGVCAGMLLPFDWVRLFAGS